MGSVSLKNGMLQFRHCLVVESNGYGKVVRKGVGKHTSDYQLEIQLGLEKLQQLKEPIRSDAEMKVSVAKDSLDIFYDAMEEYNQSEECKNRGKEATAIKAKKIWEAYSKGTFPVIKSLTKVEEEKLEKFIDDLFLDIRELTVKVNKRDKKIEELQHQIDGLVKATGKDIEGKKGLTLQQCLTHFENHVICSSERAKTDLVRRVKSVLESLGMDTVHSSLNMKQILDACNKVENTNEKKYRLRDAKRFFTLLSFPPASNGLGLVNPAAAIKPGQPEAGDNETLNPELLIENAKLSNYWKAFTASLGFAGLRLSEAASLEWGMIDEKTGLIHLRATAHYPKLKNEISERDVKPFTEFFEVLPSLKRESLHETLIFPRPLTGNETKNKDNETWFEMRDDKPAAINLSGAFIEALKEATGATYEEPARRLRRWWETTMRMKGLSSVIEAMGGHSVQIGKKHYENHADVVHAAKVGRAKPKKK